MSLILIVALIGYLFGCINGAQIIGKYKNINIKASGMKNAGASNTTMLLGWKYGFIVAFIDIFKATISLTITVMIISRSNILLEIEMLYLYINALFVVFGHNYPFTMNFKGGKGTASLFGMLLFLDWKFAVIGFFILLLFAIITNYFVIGTFVLYLTFIGYTAYTHGNGTTYVASLLTILFLIKHMENFRRIANKEEITLSSLLRKEAS